MEERYLTDCEKMIQTGSSTFYQAFSMLPSPRREAVFVVYAFCRMIDNSVDEPERSPYTLGQLRQQFDQLEQAEGHFIWPALRWLFQHFPVDKQPFYSQMDGQLRDLKQNRYDTMEELETYCYLVAGTVGEMLLPILHDQPDPSIVKSGIYLGKAMQIVNILRDVGEDLDRNRRYLPLDRMQRYGYREEEWASRQVNAAFRELVDDLAETARHWLQKGLRNIDTYPASSAFCIEVAAYSYMAILDAIREQDYQVYQTRAIVSDQAKAAIRILITHKYPLPSLSKASAVS